MRSGRGVTEPVVAGDVPPVVTVDVLGALRVTVDGRPAALRGPMQGAVLARLVMAAGAVVSADRLIEDLWQGEPPPKAAGALQAHISYLRRALEPRRRPRAPARVVISQAPGYALRADPTAVDAWHFERLLAAAATEPDLSIRYRTLDTALSLWRGPVLAAYADSDWAAPEITRLTDMRWTAMEQRADAALRLDRPAEAATTLHRLVDDHPERETAARLLALALYRLGRPLEALATLRRIRTHLASEFGVESSPPLRDLESAILTHDPALTFTPDLGSARRSAEMPWLGTRLEADGTDSHGSGSTSPGPRVMPEVVGYTEQRAVLLTAAREASEGRARLVWVEGEAGAGKSTLVAAVAAELTGHGWNVVTGRCPEVDGAPSAWAWRQAHAELGAVAREFDDPIDGWRAEVAGAEAGVSTAARVAASGVLPEVEAVASEVMQEVEAGSAAAVGAEPPRISLRGVADTPVAVRTAALRVSPVAEGDSTPFELARAVARRCVGVGPLLMVLEDAHRADGATLQILRQVVAWTAGEPVLFAVTLRGSEAGEEVRATSAALAAVTSGRLELGGLDAAAVRVVLAAAGVTEIEDGAVELVRQRTGGNPLFVVELAKLAAAEGNLLGLPAGVRDVLHRRIARLPAEAARLLRLLSVWGDEADIDSLLQLAGESEETLIDLVDMAVVAGLLRIDGGRIRFGHALTRDAVYDGIPALRRARMHWTALGVAERAPAPDLDVLAHHALVGAHAGNAEQALAHVLAAARHRTARRAFAESESLWRAVLDLHTLAGHPDDGAHRDTGIAILEARCARVAALAYGGNDAAARLLRAQALDLAEHLAGSSDPQLRAAGPATTMMRSGASGDSATPLVGGPQEHEPEIDSARNIGAQGAQNLGAGSARDLAAATAPTPGKAGIGAVNPSGLDISNTRSPSAAADPVAFALGCWRAPLIWATRDKRLPDERMIGALRSALDRPLARGDRVRLLVTLVFEVEGDDDRLAFAASAEAVALAREFGDAELLCAAVNARAFLALGPDLWSERAPLAAELLAVSTAAGLVEFQAVAHFLGCLIACSANDLAAARAEAERGLECATGGQLRQMLTVLSTFSAVLSVLRGDLAVAGRIYAECSAAMVASGTANGAELLIVSDMVLGWARGDLSALVEPMSMVYAVAPEAMVFPYVLALCDAGEIDRAREVFVKAAPIKRDHYWSVMVVFRARAAIRLNDSAAMTECYRDMLSRTGTMAGLDTGSVVYGPMDTVLAELTDALGDPAAAADHRANAAALSARITAQLDRLQD
ncbi:BTAD domain-containing putative transcriptional regulator [Nocardia anaemiae]|uniref:BTAD domain-containing putative transcriptional regulator n=1 Tax=Nocardia anaemiae TaxID=263910 RepID=UPI0007A4302D|nr:BTAD domain-containing putative transcriptional regulator [Nocardia anaemiae]